MNLASLWKLPVVFVIENNQYGMGTAVTRSAAGESLFERGKGFGIPGKKDRRHGYHHRDA